MSLVRRTDAGPIARLTLASPQTRNALSDAMLEALGEALAAAEADSAIRVIVIDAEGPAFSAGHDLKELQAHRNDPDRGRAFAARIFAACGQVMQQIALGPKPVIAAVEGVATAAGCQLVASCDLAVAGANARFATPGVNIGLFCTTPMVALTRTVAPKHAMEMLLTGDMIDAQAALRFGLVNRVAPAGEAAEAALGLAETIAAKSPDAIARGKPAFQPQAALSLSEAYAMAQEVMVENMLAADAAEGMSAFLEKRAPNWSKP